MTNDPDKFAAGAVLFYHPFINILYESILNNKYVVKRQTKKCNS